MTRIGVAGWDYPDWNGVVYPGRPDRGFDRLAYLARFVDVVEINSTFYRPVDPHQSSAWIRRTERHPGFCFTAKAHRCFTHDATSDLPGAMPAVLAGLAPLREARSLGALLLQFPQSFHESPGAFDRLQRLFDLLDGWPLVVEVRHVSWKDRADWFRERSVGWCVVDQPRVGTTTLRPTPCVTSETAYLRLHGRNAADWFRKDAGRDARYDYLYSLDELRPLAECAAGMARQAGQAFLIQNNHFRGKGLVNALQMKHLISGRRMEAPASLVAAYPELEPITLGERDRLF